MLKIIDLKDNFISYIDVNEKTTKTYLDGINNFFKFLNGNNKPIRNDILRWKTYLMTKYSANTINTYLVSVKSFFKYLSELNYYPNIVSNVKGIKISTTPKKNIMTQEEVKNIYNNLTDLREKALFGLLITTGLRGVEVASAKIENLKKVKGEICLFIKCKGHIEYDEYVKIANNVEIDISNYIRNRKTGHIFISNKGQGLTEKTIRSIVKKIYTRFGLDDLNLSLHSTRRTGATIMYDLGQSVYDIQQVLHHKNINTTVRYIKEADRSTNNSEIKVANCLIG